MTATRGLRDRLHTPRARRKHRRRRRAARAGQARRHAREGSAGPRARDRQGHDRSAVVGGRTGQGDQGQGRRQGQGRPGDLERRRRRRAGRRAEAGTRDAGEPKRRDCRRRRRPRSRANAAAKVAGRRAADSSSTSKVRSARRPTSRARSRRGRGPEKVVDISRGARPAAEPAAPELPVAPAAPSVRRMARELGVDIDQVAGSGTGGRISVDDVKAHAKRLVTGAGRRPAAPAPAEPLPDFSRWGEIERQPMRAVRRKTAEHLSAAWATIPHVTQHDLADITSLEELRKRYAKQAEAAGGNLTVTAIAVKVVAAALKVFPQFNSSIDLAAERDHLQEVREHRHRGRHRSRAARAGHPQRRHQEHHADLGRARAAVREGAEPQDLARRDAGRLLQHLEPRRHRRHVLHADRQRAGSRHPRHLARADGAGLRQGDRTSSCRG